MADERGDDDLVAAHVAGDSLAFEELVRRHQDKIFAMSLRLMTNRADAMEATQETFITAFRRASSFRGESAFGTWLYRVGINTCKDLLRRKQAREREIQQQWEIPWGTDATVAVEARLDVRRALERLPDEYREAVVMYDLGGIPYEEIARLTKARLGTVKSRISRGRRMLAEFLEPQDPGAGSNTA